MIIRQIGTYIFLLLIIAGCQMGPAQEDPHTGQRQIEGQRAVDQTADDDHHAQVGRDGDAVAKHLVELATSLPEINDATAIVIGDFAIVGIDVDSEIDRSDVGSIKYQVAEAFQDDPLGANAFVVADPDINVRLREMQADIERGRPIAGIMDELAGIVGRLMPIVPGPEHRVDDPTDTNDDRLDEGEQRLLERKQDKQTNEDLNQDRHTLPEEEHDNNEE